MIVPARFGRARPRPIPKLDENAETGPATGAKIPAFDIPGQDGKRRTFENLRGPKGARLLKNSAELRGAARDLEIAGTFRYQACDDKVC